MGTLQLCICSPSPFLLLIEHHPAPPHRIGLGLGERLLGTGAWRWRHPFGGSHVLQHNSLPS